MQNLKDWLSDQNLTKTALGQKIGMSPQGVNQALSRNSAKFLRVFNETFSETWQAFYDTRNSEYVVADLADTSATDYAVTVHRFEKREALKLCELNTPVFHFVAALPDEFDVYFDSPAEENIVFSERSSSRVFGIFPIEELTLIARKISFRRN